MKYAIQVWLEDSWMYVTTGTRQEDLKPMLFEQSIDAEDIAESWRLTGKEQYVKVVPYNESENS